MQALGSTDYTEYVATQFLTPDATPEGGSDPAVGYSTTTTAATGHLPLCSVSR